MVSGSCIGGIMYDPGNLHRVRIMACPALVDMCMHPLLLKTCFPGFTRLSFMFLSFYKLYTNS